MTKKKLYSNKHLNEAIDKYLNGVKLQNVCSLFPNIPRRTITHAEKKKKENIEAKKPGLEPILTHDMEEDLANWIIAMQSNGYPVARDTILVKANAIFYEVRLDQLAIYHEVG